VRDPEGQTLKGRREKEVTGAIDLDGGTPGQGKRYCQEIGKGENYMAKRALLKLKEKLLCNTRRKGEPIVCCALFIC